MKLIKKIALAAALSSFAMAASAMSPIQDADLSLVSGQDGVSIAANLNVNIGSFVYTTNGSSAQNAGSIGFNNINVTGTVAATLDILSAANFATPGTGATSTVLGLTGVTGTASQLASGVGTNAAGSAASTAIIGAFYSGTDVVQIAIPEIAANNLNVKIGSITMGTQGVQSATAPSFGSIALNNIQLQGTTAYIWAH